MIELLRNILKAIYQAIPLPDEWVIQIQYFRAFRRFADLRRPRTLNEKINWRKLHQRDPRFTQFADKAAVKKEVARLVGGEHVIPTLWTGEMPENIPFHDIDPPYVIKTTHGCGGNIFVRRREDVDKKMIVAALERQLKRPHGRQKREWGYYDIPRKIIIEPMIEIPGGKAPEDYKFFVYHGRAHFIQVDADRHENHQRTFYDRDWNLLPLTTSRARMGRPLPKPPRFDEMIELAELIGAAFDFVRVDLYCTVHMVFFGEATFYPSGGYSKRSPEIWDLKFGEPWNLPTPRAPERPR